MLIGAYLESLRTTTAKGPAGLRRKLHVGGIGSHTLAARTNAIVHDLSEEGLLLQTTERLSVSEQIRVVLPDAHSTIATLVWRCNDFFGCRFEECINRTTVSASRLQSDPPVSAPSDDKSVPASSPDREETFGARLRRLRKEKNIGLVGLARLVNVSKPTVWKWESGQVRPRQKSIAALTSIFGVSERELLFGHKPADRIYHQDTQLLADTIKHCKARISEHTGISSDHVVITISV